MLWNFLTAQVSRAFGLSVFEHNFVESVFATWLDWISLGVEPRLVAASGCVHRLIKCSGVAIIILDKVVIEADCGCGPWLPSGEHLEDPLV